MTTQPAIEAVDVTRVYQLGGVEVTALRGVSLRIDSGEYASIVGPSGSGKSTLGRGSPRLQACLAQEPYKKLSTSLTALELPGLNVYESR